MEVHQHMNGRNVSVYDVRQRLQRRITYLLTSQHAVGKQRLWLGCQF